ncbi:MAG: SUF system NifU family Fe-S cluster assembly protein [Acetobacteraceae bacterium]|nr:SUF system NifU family Fe-S cluster assembly protein [Acetobacteraceae bacterium]
MFDDVRDLYQEVILDHGQRPRHARRLACYDATAAGDNPMCGDRVRVWLRYAPDGSVAEAAFEGRGCAISIASADLMAETIRGRTQAEIRRLFAGFRATLGSGDPAPQPEPADRDALERLLPLGGVREYPSRVKCATLAWHAVLAALEGDAEETSHE